MALTDTKIKGLKPKEKRQRYTDANNLALMVEPHGRKYFIVRFKSPITHKYRTFNIGNYPNISLLEARKKALDIKQAVEKGIDPMEKPKIVTLKEIATECLNLKEGRVTQKHFKRCHSHMELYVYKELGDKDIKSITADEVIKTLKPLEINAKFDTLQRTLTILKEVFRYAHMRGLIITNQIQSIKSDMVFKTHKTKNYPALTSIDEVRDLVEAIKAYKGDIRTKIALKLSLLTANRPFNIRTAKWSEIDLEAKIWTIPADKMKARSEHIIPLANQTVEILKEFKKIDFKSQYLFPSQLSKTRPMSDGTVNTALRRMGYSKDEMVAHGFRSIFSTLCYEYQHKHKATSEVIEQCLAHKTANEVKSAYDRSLRLEQKRNLMQWWADFLVNYNNCKI
ncbi:tyrosine-type recombinase/integrase [Campylobacter corcagiensis]|uniref:Tyrosine-type recombinase/integrase n=1 Tax=Campylobacter corcagiensis TaxID=1448857 RepID=A0A7M1LFV5_9BACT|nr:tyrosine-type recombinase/integrase [Campylobacter corcagiensis]QKF64513.1 site-specific tyrosine recombinase, phage integrase family (INT_P4_C, DUF4102 domains) [Campylobacter corcagiensis]QOQ87310.1 tyrosine-type recombinase/integrase [Campylobacter corcagiensis]